MMQTQYQRVLLKLSGEALAGDKGSGFDEATIASICAGIRQAHDLGVQIGLWWAAATSGAAGPAERWIVWTLIKSACWLR